jgi:hypothetical protein
MRLRPVNEPLSASQPLISVDMIDCAPRPIDDQTKVQLVSCQPDT